MAPLSTEVQVYINNIGGCVSYIQNIQKNLGIFAF